MKVKVYIKKLEALVATTCVINYIMNLCNLNDKNWLICCQLATKRYLSIAVSDSKCTALIEIILKTQKISYSSTHTHSRLKQSTLVLMCVVPHGIWRPIMKLTSLGVPNYALKPICPKNQNSSYRLRFMPLIMSFVI